MNDAPYSIAPAGEEEGEFDLYNIGPTKSVFVGGIIGGDRFDARDMFTTHTVDRKDYDEQFAKKLVEIDPPHRVHKFLDHHLQHSITNLGGAWVFLDHFKYTILHPLEQHRAKSPHVAAASDWFKKTMDNIHKQHLRERNYFLSEAYRAALRDAPDDPLSVTRDPIEFGAGVGFDEATTTRIMIELVDEGLVTSSIGMDMLMVTGKGRRYLEQLHGDDDPRLNPPTIINNITAGNSSTVQVANSSAHATQTANRGDEIQDARTFVQQLSTALPEIEKVAPADQFNEIKDELEFLRKKLDSTTPSKTVIKTIKDELIKRVIGLPFDAAKWFGPEILQRF